ncbi:MAG: smc 1 [Bradyrhizobium sp.]|nr:smc 1 [Bradyrhizobium sp.]
MHIERIQIEEGFLNGFDVHLIPGLNVVIGARGTGKTSLIELIRFCLNVPSYTNESGKKSRDHALSVLGSGQITLTLNEDGRRIAVSRSAGEEAPRMSGPYSLPIVLSQTEIETVGLQPGGRLRLLDGFMGDQRNANAAEAEAVAAVRSLTAEANAIRVDIDELGRQISELPALAEQLAQLAPQEQQLAALSADATARTTNLNNLTVTISTKGVAAAATQRLEQAIQRWRAALAVAQTSAPINEPWPAGAGGDPLGAVRSRVGSAFNHIQAAMSELSAAEIEAAALVSNLNAEKIFTEDQARQLRREVESIQTGAGEIVRHGQLLRERKAQLESLYTVFNSRQQALATVVARRAQALDQLDAIRDKRYAERTLAAYKLNAVLGPRIQIGVIRAGQFDIFSAAIAEALRGSGLRYADLAASLAQRVSPRELLEAVESDNYDLIAVGAGVAKDRAAKAIVHLKEADLGAIATVAVEDHVNFSLLDGTDYKDIADLSTGQRCTVILPLVLRHTERLLIVDQPEDHIDNAFIVDTLIRSVNARTTDGQILFSTHNANIPVLGDADLVVQLGSDGKRGYPIAAAPLQAPAVVNAITTVMEGGVEAFDRRATFYGRHFK